ncbi:GpE family phage tail protein [Thiomicrorhabdus sp. Kp2]|nr:GpE family phage tail protein [Thiomicrorhabdus sp. Kp2]
MAAIAAVFHWPPREMAAMSIEELMGWFAKAKAVLEAQHSSLT